MARRMLISVPGMSKITMGNIRKAAFTVERSCGFDETGAWVGEGWVSDLPNQQVHAIQGSEWVLLEADAAGSTAPKYIEIYETVQSGMDDHIFD